MTDDTKALYEAGAAKARESEERRSHVRSEAENEFVNRLTASRDDWKRLAIDGQGHINTLEATVTRLVEENRKLREAVHRKARGIEHVAMSAAQAEEVH